MRAAKTSMPKTKSNARKSKPAKRNGTRKHKWSTKGLPKISEKAAKELWDHERGVR